MIQVRRIDLITATVLVAVMFAAFGALVATPVITVSETTYALPACITEDSDNCYWDASSTGGTSFVTLNGVTYYPSMTNLELPTLPTLSEGK
jgi:hypothetical protein